MKFEKLDETSDFEIRANQFVEEVKGLANSNDFIIIAYNATTYDLEGPTLKLSKGWPLWIRKNMEERDKMRADQADIDSSIQNLAYIKIIGSSSSGTKPLQILMATIESISIKHGGEVDETSKEILFNKKMDNKNNEESDSQGADLHYESMMFVFR